MSDAPWYGAWRVAVFVVQWGCTLGGMARWRTLHPFTLFQLPWDMRPFNGSNLSTTPFMQLQNKNVERFYHQYCAKTKLMLLIDCVCILNNTIERLLPFVSMADLFTSLRVGQVEAP